MTALQLPGGPGVRIDGHLFAGQEITLFYDPLLMKLIVHAATRDEAIARMRRALHETRIGGLTTNVPLLLEVLDDPRFASGDYDTSLLSTYEPGTRAAATGSRRTSAPVVAAALAFHRRSPRRRPRSPRRDRVGRRARPGCARARRPGASGRDEVLRRLGRARRASSRSSRARTGTRVTRRRRRPRRRPRGRRGDGALQPAPRRPERRVRRRGSRTATAVLAFHDREVRVPVEDERTREASA